MHRHAFLIHWDSDEAEAYADELRAEGWRVDVESEDGGRAFERIKQDPPTVALIFLSQASSHGREVAVELRNTAATRELPIIFVDGTQEAIQQTKSAVPNALYVSLSRARNMLNIFADSSSSAELTLSYQITIRDYNPDWPSYFEQERDRLLAVAAIGDVARQIEHVGSTSVPGLPAKVIIDLLVGLDSLDAVPGLIEPMETLGYVYREDLASLMPDRSFFERSTEGGPRFHVLFVEHGGQHWERYILFRDYLRARPEEAARYAQLKRDLAAQHGDRRHEYSQAKNEYVVSVLEKARVEFGE